MGRSRINAEVDEAIELAPNQKKASAEASTAPLEKPPARYNNIATALGAIGTWAAVSHTRHCCSLRELQRSDGPDMPLFWDLPSRLVWFLWLQLFFAAVMDSVAYICLLLVVLQIALPGPYFVGFAVFVTAALWCAIALMRFIRLYAFIPQIHIFVVLLIVTALACEPYSAGQSLEQDAFE
jgi:hypothetical protein